MTSRGRSSGTKSSVTCFPMGFSLGQKVRAMVWLMIVTHGAEAVSRAVKSRPRSNGALSVENSFAVTGKNMALSAFFSASFAGLGLPSSVKVMFSPPVSGI